MPSTTWKRGTTSTSANWPISVSVLAPQARYCLFLSWRPLRASYPPIADPVNYLSRVQIPVLMLNGRYDYFYWETSQKQLFDLLGTPAEQKHHITYDAGHAPLPRGQVLRAVVDWLDTYLGPVN